MIKYVIVEGKDELKVRLPKEFQFAYNNGDITLDEIKVADAGLQFTDETTTSYTEAWSAGLSSGDGVGTFAEISDKEVAKFSLVDGDKEVDGTVTKNYFDGFLVTYAEAFATV